MTESGIDTPKKWKGTTGGGRFGRQFLAGLIRVFGLRFMYVMMAFSIPFYVVFHVKERKAILKYYHKVLHCSRRTAFFRIFRNNYLFGKMLFDRIALMAGMRDKFLLRIPDEEIFYELARQEKGFVMGSSHIGNFELAGYALHQDKKTIHSVLFGGELPEVQKSREQMLSKNHIESILVNKDLSHIFRIKAALDKGDIVSMPCDRMLGSNKSISVRLLDRDVALPMGPFILAAQSDVSLLSIFVMYEKTRHYTIHIKEIKACGQNLSARKKAEKMAMAFAAEMEKTLLAYPDQWFNFYDFWGDDKTE